MSTPSPGDKRSTVAINAQIDVMGTHLPERQQTLRRMRLPVGQRVFYIREPNNAFDTNAVKVMTHAPKFLGLFGSGFAFLGYVPKEMAVRMAHRMDRGVQFDGAIERVWYADYQPDVEIKVRVKQLP